jgi:hypothetical protein
MNVQITCLQNYKLSLVTKRSLKPSTVYLVRPKVNCSASRGMYKIQDKSVRHHLTCVPSAVSCCKVESGATASVIKSSQN